MAKPAKPSSSARERLAHAKVRLVALHEAGLFTDLVASEIEATVPRIYRTRDVLVHAIYQHNDEHPAVYVLRSLDEIPAGLGLDGVLVRVTRRHVQITSGEHAGIFEPAGQVARPYEWERLVDVALVALGAGRRVVPLALLRDDDGMCVVANAEQARALAETQLTDRRLAGVLHDMPLPRVELDTLLRTTANALASQCSGAVARVVAGAVELELSPDAVVELVGALYNERYRAIAHEARDARKSERLRAARAASLL